MRERPILFSGPMVRALLAGDKTQTRRAVKLPHNNPLGQWEPTTVGGPGVRFSDGTPAPAQPAIWHTRTGDALLCPYGQPGDRLWVREAWGIAGGMRHDPGYAAYRADCQGNFDDVGNLIPKWRPSIHMPRWASRITLEITGVRVERLQDINDADAIAEGVGLNPPAEGVRVTTPDCETLPRVMFRALWDQINGAGAWDANPWVWVVEFRVLAQPMNQPGGAHHA